LTNREDESLNEICLTILSADKSTRFVGIVGSKDGKLLAGKFNKYSYFDSTTFIESNSFYRTYLLHAIKIRKKVKTGLLQSEVVHFKLADVGDNIYLAIAPLTGREDRLLCIYVEGYPLSLVSTKTVAK
jgi:hypothetical protein